MGREVRRVRADWQHPKDKRGQFIPLFDGSEYERRVKEWDEGNAKWVEGLRTDFNGGWVPVETKYAGQTYEQWDGKRPKADDYMPTWTAEEATHLMMYEDTTEGTPISPAFETAEELARWLSDSGASRWGGMTAPFEEWLGIVQGGFGGLMMVKPA